MGYSILRTLGRLWSFPVSIFGFIYMLLFWAFRWYSWGGIHDGCPVWYLNIEKAPLWLIRTWKGWGGHTIGITIAMHSPPQYAPTVLRHEQEHVMQCMRLGIFQPIIYLLMLLAGKVLRNVDSYQANTFEIDARLAAGQPVEPVSKVK
jgi:hypothetical protein